MATSFITNTSSPRKRSTLRREITLLLIVKLIALWLLWWFCFRGAVIVTESNVTQHLFQTDQTIAPGIRKKI